MKIIVVSSLYESIDENRRMRLGTIHILRQVGLENASFADVQYCIYADIEGVGGSEKAQHYADVMYELFLGLFKFTHNNILKEPIQWQCTSRSEEKRARQKNKEKKKYR